MSKTIEIISIHKGQIAITTRGESRTVEFEDKGDVGVAMCDNDEAGVFLKIGLPDYWKAGKTTGDAVKEAIANDPEAASAAAALMAGKKAVAEAIEKIKAATTVEEVNAILGDDTRKNVVKAAEERKAEIEAA